MSRDGEPRRFAVLIDADNARASTLDDVLSSVAKRGVAVVRRAYGDWTSNRLAGWKSVLNANAVLPVQQFSYTSGKNATDMALVIDAMDLLHSGRVEGFCIVSSDSDFTRLATRIRESGMPVIGCGDEWAPKAFVASCDEFVRLKALRNVDEQGTAGLANIVRTATHTDLFTPKPTSKAKEEPPPNGHGNGKTNGHVDGQKPLSRVKAIAPAKNGTPKNDTPKNGNGKKPPRKPPQQPPKPPTPRRLTSEELLADDELTGLLQAAALSQSDVDGWSELGNIAAFVRTHLPEFRPRNYGYSQFLTLVEATGLFVIIDRPNRSNAKNPHKYVRTRDAGWMTSSPTDFSDDFPFGEEPY